MCKDLIFPRTRRKESIRALFWFHGEDCLFKKNKEELAGPYSPQIWGWVQFSQLRDAKD